MFTLEITKKINSSMKETYVYESESLSELLEIAKNKFLDRRAKAKITDQYGKLVKKFTR